MTVSVYGLPQHGHLADAAGHQQLHLAGYVVYRAADLAAAAVGDDAERAHQVAAVDDRHMGGYAGADGRQVADAALPIHAQPLPQQIQQGFVLLGAHKDVYIGKAALQRGGLGAYHTAHQRDYRLRVALLDAGYGAEVADHLILGGLPDYAGIQNDDIGVLRLGGGFQPQLLQRGGQTLGVRRVHLAADGPDVIAVHSRIRRYS